jgi:hypothetical protein
MDMGGTGGFTPRNFKNRFYIPETVRLGDLTDKYFSFRKALELSLDFPAEEQYRYKKRENVLTIRKLTENLQKLDTLMKIKQDNNELSIKWHTRDSMLYFSAKVLSESQYDQTKQAYYNSTENLVSVQNEYINTQNQIKILNNSLLQLELDEKNYAQKIYADLITGYSELKHGITQWLDVFVLKAPISGKLEFLDFWKEYDNISQGQELFSIVPDKNYLQGNSYLTISRAGKVATGQQVYVKLENYPFNEYGIVKGVVRTVSVLAGKKMRTNDGEINAYLVTVDLPQGLTTNYGMQLGFQHQLKGLAEIVTDKRRLIERLFDNLKYIAQSKE